MRFDGTNETEVANWFRATYGTWLTPYTGNFLLGVLSEAENKTIAAGLNDVIMDYVEDVVDRERETDLVFRSGATKAIQPGSWIVNCTGYVLRQATTPMSPTFPRSGAVVSIQPRSAILHLTSYIAYFLSHLLFLGKIGDVPLYELDLEDLQGNRVPHTRMRFLRLSSTTSASSPTAFRPRCSSTADSTSITGTRCRAAWQVRHGSC